MIRYGIQNSLFCILLKNGGKKWNELTDLLFCGRSYYIYYLTTTPHFNEFFFWIMCVVGCMNEFMSWNFVNKSKLLYWLTMEEEEEVEVKEGGKWMGINMWSGKWRTDEKVDEGKSKITYFWFSIEKKERRTC